MNKRCSKGKYSCIFGCDQEVELAKYIPQGLWVPVSCCSFVEFSVTGSDGGVAFEPECLMAKLGNYVRQYARLGLEP